MEAKKTQQSANLFRAIVRGDDQVPSIVVVPDEDLRFGVSNFRFGAGSVKGFQRFLPPCGYIRLYRLL